MVTADTNIAFYAFSQASKTDRAEQILSKVDFLSVQVLNEYASASHRKLRKNWPEIQRDLLLLSSLVGDVVDISQRDNVEAMRIADRYKLSFYDALIVAVALAKGATVFYSEDMHNGLVIDAQLTITNPFLELT